MYCGSDDEKSAAAYPINELFTKEIANNIWHIAPVRPDYIDQSAPFPEEIPYWLITMYSHPGELVLDPFAGSGQTPEVAKLLGRQFAGYEVIQKYVDLANSRLHELPKVPPEKLLAVFDKIRFE